VLGYSFESVYLMLGSDCNANCSYCLQKGNTKKQKFPDKLNYKVIDFIELMASRYYESQENTPVNNRKYFWVTYFGGEPLLKFDLIKEVNEELLKRGVIFRSSIITNGLLLDEDKVNYFNKHNFVVALSHDGLYSKKNRGYNVFEIVDSNVIMKINRLALNAVLTVNSYLDDIIEDYLNINEKYSEVHNYNIEMNIETFLDTGSCNQEKLDDFDYDKLYNQSYNLMMKYAKGNYNDKTLPSNNLISKYIKEFILKVKNNINSTPERGGCYCGRKVLNLDLDGNLYSCHNSSFPISRIEDSINDYFINLGCADRRVNVPPCEDCYVKFLCVGGCKMVPEELDEKYCKMQRAFYGGFIKALCDWGENCD